MIVRGGHGRKQPGGEFGDMRRRRTAQMGGHVGGSGGEREFPLSELAGKKQAGLGCVGAEGGDG